MNTGLVEKLYPDVSAASATLIKGQVKMKCMPVLFSVFGRLIGWRLIGGCAGWGVLSTRLRPQ